MKTKEFKCENGKTYLLPENHCAFCEHCADVFYDYTNGPYMFLCNANCVDYKECFRFEKRNICEN